MPRLQRERKKWCRHCCPKKPRGFEAQRKRREEERLAKVAAVQFALWAKREHRYSTRESARRLRLSSATLSSWLRGWRKDVLALAPRGRPTIDSDRDLRLAVLAIFDLCGPEVGQPTLQEFFPSMPARELLDLADRYRDFHCNGKNVLVHALTWNEPGTVWAMDYTVPPNVIEGVYKTILCVRDLASGKTLAAMPSDHDDARTTIDVLRALFAEHGPPLCIKSDNGCHFVAGEVQALLAEYRVAHLRSPFYSPTFNGSIEAGICSLKIRAHYEAARHNRPGEWTTDDVEGARLRGNELGRPHGMARGTPDAEWARRAPIAEDTRRSLLALISQYELEEARRRGYQEGAPLGDDVRLSIGRDAIGRALCQLGFVHYRRRRIPLPNPRFVRSRIA
jgi:transposase InsO family protein